MAQLLVDAREIEPMGEDVLRTAGEMRAEKREDSSRHMKK
jgi:hypothetical protein